MLVVHAVAVHPHTTLVDHPHRLRGAGGEARLLENLDDGQRLGAGLQAHFRDVVRDRAVPESGFEVGQRTGSRARAVEALDDLASEQDLGIARVAPAGDFLSQRVDRFAAAERQQVEVAPHQLVRNRHQLAEHLGGRLVDADVVAK
ncbi:MAG: hypothetical protein AW08_01230 [Candidatus Accumulibacter adjunctus]|uniref:Uncharacterized protein n=1 Tax=Candidatus Accumulibacter adjunctus TaxID=1454001 RepID=A0A011MF88_9PROT|nr:MAG: hypothetical protein AW08_01230 [Candidatus Accumulibacter adjunctus]